MQRFLSEDPILAPYTPLSVSGDRSINNTIWELETPGLNTPHLLNAYSYVQNNPIKFSDPSGLLFEDRSCNTEINICTSAVSSGESGPNTGCSSTSFNSIGDKCKETKCATMNRNCRVDDLKRKTDKCFGEKNLPPPACQPMVACFKNLK